MSNAPSDELIGDHVASYRVQHLIGERSKGAYVVQRFIAGGSLKDRIKAVVDHRTWP